MVSRVLLLAAKDTIAYSTRPGREAVASGAELLDTLPRELLAADVVVEDVLAEPSWDVTAATMLGLGRRVRAAVTEDGFDGVVISYGIDTLAETAFLVDLMAGPAASRAAIVLTGAVRHRDELSADGPRNLAAALTTATAPALVGAGAVVCVDDELHAARWVSMVDATTVRGFSSAPAGVLGRVVGTRVELLGTPPPRPPEAHGDPESDVALVKTYPGIDPALLTTVVDAGARGVVLEGTGLGNVPVDLFVTIGDLTAADIPVVVASRCRTRPVGLSELPAPAGLAAKVGAIGARGLAPEKARVALMAALGGDGGVAAAREWFDRLASTGGGGG